MCTNGMQLSIWNGRVRLPVASHASSIPSMLLRHPFTLLYALPVLAALAGACLSTPSHAQVYHCGNTYSDEPCQGAQALDVQPSVQSHGGKASNSVFLCRLGERQFWSPQSCQSHNATMLRSQSVPKNWTWEQQWKHAEREWQQAERRTAAQAPLTHHADTSQLAQRRRARPDCAQADQRIRQLDDMGRRGGSVEHMERIRAERKETRDRQFRVGC